MDPRATKASVHGLSRRMVLTAGAAAPKLCPVCLHPQAFYEPAAEKF